MTIRFAYATAVGVLETPFVALTGSALRPLARAEETAATQPSGRPARTRSPASDPVGWIEAVVMTAVLAGWAAVDVALVGAAAGF